jgi:hypothetical protein
MKHQPRTEATAAARARTITKVTRPAEPWREMYHVEGVGVAVHRAVTENA